MKRLFKMFRKHYKTGYTYTVKLSDIIIQPGWNHIKTWKMNEKMNYFEKTGRFASTIIIDREFVLRDGFTSYRIAEIKGMKYVNVYFVE
jgi:hypothetical protein